MSDLHGPYAAVQAVSHAGTNGLEGTPDAKQSPSRDSTPRKADRPDISRIFASWLSGFR